MPEQSPTLVELIGSAAAPLSDLDRSVLLERLTLDGSRSSFAAIGARKGISRAKSAATGHRILGILDERARFSDPIRHRLSILSDSTPFPAAALLDEPWARGLSLDGATFVAESFSRLRRFKAGRLGDCLMPMARKDWEAVERAVAAAAAEANADDPALAVFARGVASLAMPRPAREASLRALASIHAGRNAIGLMYEYGNLDAWVDALLPPGGPAAKLSDILVRQHASSPERLTLRQLRAILSERSLKVGTDLFRSLRAPPFEDRRRDAIADHCVRLVLGSAPGRRWRAHEMLASLTQCGLRSASAAAGEGGRLSAADLDSILHADGRLVRIAAWTWTGHTPPPERGVLRHVVEGVLEAEGRPLPLEELTRRVVGIWGSAASGQIANERGSSVVALGGGIIGLWPRDVPLREGHLADRVGDMARAMMARGPAKVTDVLSALSAEGHEADPHHVRAALRFLHRIVQSTGSILREEGSPRPFRGGTFKAAMADVLRRHPEGLTVPEILGLSIAAAGKEMSEGSVRSMLALHGRRHPTRRSAWILAEGEGRD